MGFYHGCLPAMVLWEFIEFTKRSNACITHKKCLKMTTSQIRKIVIIGGGTAGWWCAGYLEKELPDVEITLIESDTIPKIGVGETTLPQIKTFFDDLGIDEKDWMDRCGAVRKYGNIKQGWISPNDEEFNFSFWWNDNNVFDQWIEEYWAGRKTKNQINDDLYKTDGWQNYAYHLDAEQAGSVVKERCQRVKHLIQTITPENLPPADLYVDCTGFARRFVKDHTWLNFDHHLVDSAVVCPFELEGEPIPYTKTLGKPYGWQFVVSLQHRIGSGYVYSSKYLSHEQALLDFKAWTRDWTPFKEKTPRLITWKPGVLKNPWAENTVAIGMSSGFIDPLEANSLFMTQFQITTLAKCIKRQLPAKAYNRLVTQIWRDISTFIQHHYMLCPRNDTEFWRYYNQFDASETLWQNYLDRGNKYSNAYPDAFYATLGLYFNEFKHYKKKCPQLTL
jgi:tryptophan 7-halogenase